MQLSKSDYIAYLKHPAWLWLKKHDRDALPAVDAATQAIFDNGHLFEKYAEALFPEAVSLGFNNYQEYVALTDKTTQSIASGAKTIFQARFEYEQLTFVGDVIQLVGEGLVDLYEIKSTTSPKVEHILDLAFQMVVLEKCGFRVRKIFVIHVNNQYVRKGEIDPRQLSSISEVTEQVRQADRFTKLNIDKALAVMSLEQCPDLSPVQAGLKYFSEWLEVYKYLKKPKSGSIYNLAQLDHKLLKSLEKRGISSLADIPLDDSLKSKQRLQLEALTKGPIIDVTRIRQFLDSFTYPLYFLDYETLSGVVPAFDGLKPYQQLPFQYSLHVLEASGTDLRHYEFLHRDKTNPVEPLSEALSSQIGDSGTVITWNMSFEKNCNSLMAQLRPQYKSFYEELNERVVDLMLPFKNGWYVDAEFGGSASIKSVLPVLVPELSYKLLDISDGGTAQRLWMEAVLNGDKQADKDKIFSSLIEYCKLDTLAMVEIYSKIKTIIGG